MRKTIPNGNTASPFLDRRRFLATGAGFGLSATGLGQVKAQEENRPLRILGWSHYFSSSITQRFREETGVEIEVTGIGAVDDVVLFLRSGGIGLYDLVAPTSGLLGRMFDAGLIQPIDEQALPALPSLFEQFRNDVWAQSDAGRIGVPILWGSLAAVLPEDQQENAPATWLEVMGEPFAKRVLMSDDPLGHYWIWNLALGAEDPTRISRDQLDATTAYLIQMKKSQATSWDSSVFGAMRRMAGGRGTIASVGWQSAPLLSEPGERQLIATHPEPGDASFCDNLALVSEAPQPELAVAFIDYMIQAETQAMMMNETKWFTVNADAVPLMNPEVAALVDYAGLDAHLQRSPVRGYPPFSDDGSDTATYFDWLVAWDRVRATRVGG